MNNGIYTNRVLGKSHTGQYIVLDQHDRVGVLSNKWTNMEIDAKVPALALAATFMRIALSAYYMENGLLVPRIKMRVGFRDPLTVKTVEHVNGVEVDLSADYTFGDVVAISNKPTGRKYGIALTKRKCQRIVFWRDQWRSFENDLDMVWCTDAKLYFLDDPTIEKQIILFLRDTTKFNTLILDQIDD